jgi:hypothetical protein
MPACHAAMNRRTWLSRVGAAWLAGVHGAPGWAAESRSENHSESEADRAAAEAALAGPNMPYAAFDRMPFESLPVEGGRIRVVFGPTGAAEPALSRAQVLSFVRQSARSVATYFGRFPAADTRLLVLFTPAGGRPVRGGTAFAHQGAAIKVTLSASATPADLNDDWVLVHEMSHLALPSLPRRQHWFEEGMASYVEPLARAQAGVLPAERVWADMVAGMPQGLPQAGDQGLDNTPTWGRTYWGGALFCLLADVGIRQRTGNRQGLQHALRAILERGNMESDSEIQPLLAQGDAATGVPVLAELYAQMKGQPHPVDLDAMWRSLGVRAEGRSAVFDDQAPLAATRRALTTPLTTPLMTPLTTPVAGSSPR